MIAAVLLAGGASKRMGTCKALLRSGELSFLQILTSKLRLVTERVVIVTGEHHAQIHAHAATSGVMQPGMVTIVPNPHHQLGMLSSLQCGLREVADAEWVMYQFVDQPGLPEEFYHAFLLEALPGRLWVQPVVAARTNHPVLLHRDAVELVLHAKPTATLREVLQPLLPYRTYWQYSGPGNFQDIDTPEEYDAFVKKNDSKTVFPSCP